MPITQDPRINTSTGYYLNGHDHQKASCRHFLSFVRDNAIGSKLLDMGCGIGSYAYELQTAGYKVTGVEQNAEYVAVAKSIGVNAICNKGVTLPFADDEFETTYMLEVLEHIADKDMNSILMEVRRVTQHRLLVTVPDNTQYNYLVGSEFLYGHYRAVDHVQFFTAKSLANLLGEFFPNVSVIQGDPLFPHQLLPILIRKPLSALYRLGILKPHIFSRLFAIASF